MKTLNKTLIALAVSISCVGFAYADTYNPFIAPPQDTQPATQQDAGSQASAKQTQPALQPTQPTYNFSQRNNTTAPPPFLVSNTGPGAGTNSSMSASSTAIPTPMPLGPGGTAPAPLGPGGTAPTPLGPGGTAPSSASSLLQAILNLDADVKNTNKLSISQWNQTVQNQAQANAMLLPTDLNFLWGQTGYQNMQQLVPSGNNQQNALQNILVGYSQNICNDQDGTSQTCQQITTPTESAVPAALMTPQSISQFPAGLLNQTQDSTIIDTSYIRSLLANLSNNAAQHSDNIQLAVLGAARYALSNIASNNQADRADGVDSQMNILNTAVSMPFSNTPDPTTSQTWFQQLSVASEPQLLRSVAVMLALNNYLQYQNLKATQTQQLLQSAQLVQEVRLENAINQLNDDQAARTANALGQIRNLLQSR